MAENYNFSQIEGKWQQKWEEAGIFHTPELKEGDEKAYVLDMFPYPSGAGIHMGHTLSYTGSDVMARTARLQGKKVHHPMGWDAFGLPAENFAIKSGVHPALSTKNNTENFRRQLKQAGFSYDWEREINTSEPEYYKWTQWLFTVLYERGLAYRKEGLVNWCPKCQTVLANEQVVSGLCERCETPVIQKQLKQWYFKITEYAERLLQDLDALDWPEKIKAMQRNWIGKSEGAQIFFTVDGSEQQIEVFTTRPDTIYGATYLVLAPEHPLVEQLTKAEHKPAVLAYRTQTAEKTELERTFLEKEKSGVFTGAYALNPLTGKRIPIWIADYVLASYGTGAIMAVPAHDERDFAFALKYELPIEVVVEPITGEPQADEEFRRSLVAIVYNSQTNQYLSVNWGKELGGTLFIGGGLEEGEDLVSAAQREIQEETGLTDLELVAQSENVHHHYVAHSKGKKRYILATGLLFTLKSEEGFGKVQLEEDEKNKFTLEWITAAQAENQITDPLHSYIFQRLVRNQIFTGHGIAVHSGEMDGLPTAEAKKQVIVLLESKGHGKAQITYRLRDWLVSRQRFWGSPIPIAYDQKGEEHVLPLSELPVALPMDVEFLPTGQSPLGLASEWKKYRDPQSGEEMTREVDTLDTFVCSSWYYLRYLSARNHEQAFDPELTKRWLPVDMYIGGAEHAVLHLLYARFFTKVLFDAGYLTFDEPFKALRNQGIILGPDHNKMSKSKGNIVNPDDIIAESGADTLRTYVMFMGPFEQEKPWSTQGMVGIKRFLERVWRLQDKVSAQAASEAELRIMHKVIKKVTDDIAELKFNTAIAALMEALNQLTEQSQLAQESYLALLTLLNPFAPHITEELWELQGQAGFASLALWPRHDEQYLTEESVEYPVQINGKVRFKVVAPLSASQEEVLELVRNHEKLAQFQGTGTIQKEIFVPGKLVSLVVTG